jgi:hypothetical protein
MTELAETECLMPMKIAQHTELLIVSELVHLQLKDKHGWWVLQLLL